MQSFILISQDDKKKTDYIARFCEEKGVGKFDCTTISPEENSLGIKDIREAQKLAYLAPASGGKKLLVFDRAESLTRDAQNALLKLLEEPPQNLFLILSATTDQAFLPTILSRCKIIALEKEREKLSQEKRDAFQKDLLTIQKGSIAGKLALAERLAGEKENLGIWLITALTLLREAMLATPGEHTTPSLITQLQEANRLIQTTNVSPREILEHAFLSIQP